MILRIGRKCFSVIILDGKFCSFNYYLVSQNAVTLMTASSVVPIVYTMKGFVIPNYLASSCRVMVREGCRTLQRNKLVNTFDSWSSMISGEQASGGIFTYSAGCVAHTHGLETLLRVKAVLTICSEVRSKSLGPRMAGAKNRRKMKPDTTE